MAKPEPRQGSRNLNSACSSTSNVLWFKKYLLRSYYVKDTASLEDALKDQIPVLKNLATTAKTMLFQCEKYQIGGLCTLWFTQISQIQRLSGINQLTWMKHAENKPQRQLKDLGYECWVPSKRFFLIGMLSLIKNIYKKFTPDIVINGENLIAFPLRSGTRPRISPFTTAFQYHWMS